MTGPFTPNIECTLCGDEATFFGQDDWNMCRACHARFTAQQTGIVQRATPPESVKPDIELINPIRSLWTLSGWWHQADASEKRVLALITGYLSEDYYRRAAKSKPLAAIYWRIASFYALHISKTIIISETRA